MCAYLSDKTSTLMSFRKIEMSDNSAPLKSFIKNLLCCCSQMVIFTVEKIRECIHCRSHFITLEFLNVSNYNFLPCFLLRYALNSRSLKNFLLLGKSNFLSLENKWKNVFLPGE